LKKKKPIKKPRTINPTMQNPRQKWVQILNLHDFQCLLNDNSLTRLKVFSIANLRKNSTNSKQAIIYKNSQDIHYAQINFVTIFLGKKLDKRKQGTWATFFIACKLINFLCVQFLKFHVLNFCY
jgi:hypothetical protein